MPQPYTRETAVLRALASPARQEILELLAGEPATSAMVARALGSNSGVASYHLRELGKAGLIEPDAARSHGRQRFWRVAAKDIRFADPSESEQPVLARAAIDLIMARLTDSVRRYVERTDLGPDWRDAALFSRTVVTLTADDLAELQREYLDLVHRWTRTRSELSSARPVRLALFAFPDDHDPREVSA